MSTLQEIKTAISNLPVRDRDLLVAELFAQTDVPPDVAALEDGLRRGLQDIEQGRVRPLNEVRALIPAWITKS